MRVTISTGADAALVEFSDQPAARGGTRELADGVLLDTDAEGRPVALKVLGLSTRMGSPFRVEVEVSEGLERLPADHPFTRALAEAEASGAA